MRGLASEARERAHWRKRGKQVAWWPHYPRNRGRSRENLPLDDILRLDIALSSISILEGNPNVSDY